MPAPYKISKDPFLAKGLALCYDIALLQNTKCISPKWSARVEEAYQIFKDNVIMLIQYNGKIGGVAGITRGKEWLP